MSESPSVNPETPTPQEPPRPRGGRAWWQWVIGIGFILAGAGSYALRWVEKNHPEWLLTIAASETLPLKLPPDTKTVETVPVSPGSLEGMNVLLITMDTTRADRLGYYGNGDIETPAMDALATGGVFFSRAITTSPTTLPSHSSILTGLFPFHHGARMNGQTRLAPEHETMAEILGAKGYKTAAYVSAFVLAKEFGTAQGFEVYDDETERFDDAPIHREAERRGDITTDRALEWLKGNAKDKFFLWVHYYDAHAPYELKPGFEKRYEDNAYHGEIAFIDSQVRRLTDFLKSSGTREKTLIVLVGDHGEGLGQHREWAHGILLYDPTMHVPFLLNCPGKIPANLHIAKEVCVVDVLPTVLSMLGIASPAAVEGTNLCTEWDEARPIYGETAEGFNQYGLAPLLSVRSNRIKYIYAPVPELYNLASDPDEDNDLAPASADTAKKMYRQLQKFFGVDLDKASSVANIVQLSGEDAEKLAALGYVGSGLSVEPGSGPLPNPKDVMPIINELELAMDIRTIEERSVAIQKMEALAEKHPEVYAIHHKLADLYYRENQFFMAQAAVQRALDVHPDVTMNLVLLARTHMNLKETEKAIAAYRRAIDSASKKGAIISELGRYLLVSGRVEEAIRELQAAFELMPNDWDTVEPMVDAMQRSGRAKEAEGMLRARLGTSPDFVSVRAALAGLLADTGAKAEALTILEAGLALNPQQPELTNALVEIVIDPTHGEPGRVIEAVARMERVCTELTEPDARYLYTLSMAYMRQGKAEQAVAVARQALEVARKTGRSRLATKIERELQLLQNASP